MKKSIGWHKECLENSIDKARRDRVYAEKCIASVEMAELRNRFSRAQIALAIREKKDGFDREIYGIKRLPVTTNEL